MKKQLAIKGHEARGEEVIEILEMLGASNKKDYTGSYPSTLYILNDNNIDLVYACDYDNQEIFKLEEFLEKYPYKVGDKVINDNYSSYGIITTMIWDSDDWCVKYRVEFEDFGVIEWFKCNEIKISDIRRHTDYTLYTDPLHELCQSKLSSLMIDSEVCGDEVELILNGYEIVTRGDKTYAIKKKPKYPKSYYECCKVLDTNCTAILRPGYRYREFENFQKLLICRDAYWKIAGEQMGLGKSWEPDWDNLSTNHEFIKINKGCFTYSSRVLVFPTKEMCDEFFENFEEMIEKCKKLL